jgi:hypothetical protein
VRGVVVRVNSGDRLSARKKLPDRFIASVRSTVHIQGVRPDSKLAVPGLPRRRWRTPHRPADAQKPSKPRMKRRQATAGPFERRRPTYHQQRTWMQYCQDQLTGVGRAPGRRGLPRRVPRKGTGRQPGHWSPSTGCRRWSARSKLCVLYCEPPADAQAVLSRVSLLTTTVAQRLRCDGLVEPN